jgi:hypothetical protein
VSLSHFVTLRDVCDRLKPLRPKPPREIPAPLRIEPLSNHYSVVGTAFDYLLRFELHRRAPHAVAETWVAEHALDLIWKEVSPGVWIGPGSWIGTDLLGQGPGQDNHLQPKELSKRARAIVESAKAAVAAHLKRRTPSRSQLEEIAAHAIRLAKLDSVVRAMRLDPRFEEAEPEDVGDLLLMLDIVPFDKLLHSETLFLNPRFKESSQIVGGADADLIAGDLLVDFKVTKKRGMTVEDLDELFGYYLLARNERHVDSRFPEIKRVAFYFCRHCYLWVLDVTTWTDHPQFSEIEKWFFDRAKSYTGVASRDAKNIGRPSS